MKNDPKCVIDSNFRLKLQTFQLSDVRELETIGYVFAHVNNKCSVVRLPEMHQVKYECLWSVLKVPDEG